MASLNLNATMQEKVEEVSRRVNEECKRFLAENAADPAVHTLVHGGSGLDKDGYSHLMMLVPTADIDSGKFEAMSEEELLATYPYRQINISFLVG